MKSIKDYLHLAITLWLSLSEIILSLHVEGADDAILNLSSAGSDSMSDKVNSAVSVDPNGYLIYCPCMGRFGNQADQFLGSLGFAKKLNRTLLLPPWRTYKNVRFDEWFKMAPIQQYHKAMLAETFMEELAPTVWPVGQRIGFCWLARPSEQGENYCPMKEGNPFGPFWDGLGVNFDKHLVYGFSYTDVDRWKTEYPGSKYPVIALKGPPASFPVREEYAPLHQYLQWSDSIEEQVDSYINTHFPGERFVGIHLRNGPDWDKACEHMNGALHFMGSPQCLGYSNTETIDAEICLPSLHTVVSLVTAVVKETKATVVYVATDKDPLLPQLQKALGNEVRVIHQNPWLPQMDLAILGRADHFIGNCVSSFTAFVSRERKVRKKPTSFWGFTKPSDLKDYKMESSSKDEL